MPLALPSPAPSLGAVAGHRRRNAPVHAARQVANNDSKTHGALVQQAVNVHTVERAWKEALPTRLNFD